MQDAVPRILVVGSSNVGKKSLIARITGSRIDQQVPVPWTIDTKYYTAQIEFLKLKCTPDGSQDSSISGCESLILTFDAKREETFREAKAWLARQSISPEITLLAANKSELLRTADGVVQRESWHEEAQDWCCEHLFEYIEVSAADEAADRSLRLDGDPQGVKRVLEALEAHTWPGLRLKAADEDASCSSNGLHHHPADEAELPQSGVQEPGAQLHSNHRQYWAHQAEDEGAVGSSQDPVLRETQPSSELPQTNSVNGLNGVPEPAASQSEQEVELDNFEAMLGRLSEARQQLQGVPDDERRARAAALAIQMMQSLGLDEDDDEDDASLSD